MSLTTPDLSSPYVGPRSFGAGERLYGRDREAQELCDLLISERIVLLHSPSGAGKTSLVQARLIPMLAEREFTVLPVMRVSQEPPAALAAGANRYLLSLLLSLQRDLPAAQQRPVEELAGVSLGEMLAAMPGQRDGQVLIFDQFEEILTIDPTNAAAKRAFFAQVGAALRDRSRWALFSMREEYIAALEPYLRPVPTRLACTFRLDLLESEAAAMAIARPAQERGVAFEPGTIAGLVNDLRLVRVQHADGRVENVPGQYVEPVQLQVVCQRLWKTWARRFVEGPPEAEPSIGAADIAAMGDVSTALEAYYDESVAEVCVATGTPERAVRDWFDSQLIIGRGLRNQLLKDQDSTGGLANTTISKLIDTYLVRAEERRSLTWYELSHDRLVEPVRDSNLAWRDRNLQQFQRQAALWESQKNPEALLLRGKALEAAEEFARLNPSEVGPLEQTYLDQCRALRGRERQARALRLTIWGLAALAFVVAIIAVNQAFVANTQRQAAELARDESRARQAALLSTQLGASRPQQALLLAVEALGEEGRQPLPEALSALYRALAATGGAPLSGPTASLDVGAFSPDGALVAAAGEDGAAYLWRTAEPGAPPVVLRGHIGEIDTLAFSPDGRLLATGSSDDTVRVWTLASPEAPPAVLTHGASVGALAFSPDGRLLATGAGDGVIQLWQTADLAAAPTPLLGHGEGISGLAFSPDGASLVSSSEDFSARVWAVARPADQPRVLAGHEDEIVVMALSPDGRTVATGSRDATVRVWDLTSDASTVLEGPGGEVARLAFSPDGGSLAVGGDAPEAQVWTLAALEQEPVLLAGHGSAVSALAYTPDGKTLISGDVAGALRFWTTAALAAPPLVLFGHDASVAALAISPDGRQALTGSFDATARLWSMDALSPIAPLRGPTAPLRSVGFAQAGQSVFAGDSGGAGTRWAVGVPGAAEPLHGPAGQVAAIVYSAEARHLLTLDFDNRLRFAALDPPVAALELYAGPERVASAAISQDGTRVAAALELASGSSVQIWETARPAEPGTLTSGSVGVAAVAFSGDGSRLATGDLDGLVQIWALPGGELTRSLRGHGTFIQSLAFSPDGALLASSDTDGLVYVWDTATGGVRAALNAGPQTLLNALAIAPDKGRLAAAGQDGLARVWDLERPNLAPISLAGHSDSLQALAYSPDGAALVTAGADALARHWPTRLGDLRAAACATAQRNLSYEEWRSAFGGEPYRKTCPNLPVAPQLIDGAIALASQSQIAEALGLAQQLSEAGYADEVPARAWGALCRAGGLAGSGAQVLAACDQAIALDPDDGQLYDWRALARAAAGDLEGARADLERYLAWGRALQVDPEALAAREGWAADLAAGANPYDEAALQIIRRER